MLRSRENKKLLSMSFLFPSAEVFSANVRED